MSSDRGGECQEKDVHMMSTTSRKSRSHSARPAKGRERRRSSKKRSSSAKSTQTEVDILSPAAMENVYYISHNAVDCLEFRGFRWPASAKKKRGKKVKKNKK
ncbi:small lysine-rich protein 1 isoform X1 [Hypomesus transpacificus]|uniref:small lysine-rich protein 1 isoform X1 n=2 Tax=Hypomesus transpacificus TaxID=137520 RepID=UPI001F07FE94|nr:small lysine-rich protein 1 isoform X1 [Hypomesus transpacificus]